MESQSEAMVVNESAPAKNVSERCRESWASYEAASREVGARANASWLSMERERAGVEERSSASWQAIQAAASACG